MAIVLDGLAFGLQLSLLAVGLTLVHGLGGVLNLAHGQFVAVAAIVGATLLRAGVAAPAALAAAVASAGLLAWIVDMTLMRPVYREHGEARTLLSLLLTLGLAFAIDGVLITFHPVTRLQLGVSRPSVELLGVTMRSSSVLAAVVAAVVLLALAVMLRTTRQGRALRAVAQDEEGARLCGVDPARARTFVFVLSGVLAGVASITQGLVGSVGATSGLDLTILALIVTVVGGLGRVSGALTAGIVLGVVHAVASFAVGTVLTFVILMTVAIVVLLLRPSGILGARS